jgi:hypothetical protein
MTRQFILHSRLLQLPIKLRAVYLLLNKVVFT